MEDYEDLRSRNEKVTPAWVRKQVEAIYGVRGNDEIAHGEEDCLYLDLLTAISEGKCYNVRECAKIAITVAEMDFSRWCA